MHTGTRLQGTAVILLAEARAQNVGVNQVCVPSSTTLGGMCSGGNTVYTHTITLAHAVNTCTYMFPLQEADHRVYMCMCI